jgi:hypothetical protein
VSRAPLGPYLYENLGEDEFQKLCQVIIATKFDRVTCYPVGQKDGGRDITRKSAGGVIYQVKWSKNSVRDPLTWLETAVKSEADSIEARVNDGATHYVLMTSISGTAAFATGPGDRGAGTIDKLDATLAEHAERFGLQSMDCWWRDDLDALVSALPRSVLWRYQKMLCGPEAMRFLLDADRAEARDSNLVLLIRKVVGAQWEQDSKVKFKQAELEKDDLEDLFVDVKARVAAPPNVEQGFARSWSVDSVAAVNYLVSSSRPFTLVRGEPGQGKSTLAQYLSQVYRSQFIEDVPGTRTKRPVLGPPSERVPLRIDLRDYGAWLEGTDPFAESPPNARARSRQPKNGAVEKFLRVFLASVAAVDQVDAETVDDLLNRFPVLLVFDGLDEVAQRTTRQKVVEEIEKLIGRWRANGVPPKIVITTRPNLSGLPEPSAQRFETVTLLKLDHELRLTYLRKWCAARGITGRDRRDLIHSFDSRTAEPHIAQLAENPMQLTILLYLLHLQGHSVPDKRTPLYDDYMKTFLNREAEKSASVRENRESLEEITAYLGWHLQGLAEQEGGSGRLRTTALKTEIFRYLTIAEKDTSLVDALFTDVTDRVWALTSKVQGTFEFDVQPVREFFAAKYLAQYATAHKSEVLKALIRRPFWFNSSRFYAGFAHANEVSGLVDGLTEELEEMRHPLPERVALWTLLADGVFSSKTIAQRRATELLSDDLGVRLLVSANLTNEPIPKLPADRGWDQLRTRLLDTALESPGGSLSGHRLRFVAYFDEDADSAATQWLQLARKRFGRSDELVWLRLGASINAGRLLSADDLDSLALTAPGAASAAVAAGISPPPRSDLERQMILAATSGKCGDVVSQRTGYVADLVNALAPREFVHLAKPDDAPVFEHLSAHSDKLLPTLKRQEAFRRLKSLSPAFGLIQRAMNIVRRSPSTVAPWSDAAESLRKEYGPTWLAAEIAVIGAAIDPKIRRDVGPMNPSRSPFGPNIDYGRLVNDVRVHRKDLDWWVTQRGSLDAPDRALWVYALVGVAATSVLQACLAQVAGDLETLDDDLLTALMASSSRLGLSRVSRRLPAGLVTDASAASPATGLLVAHHVDVDSEGRSPSGFTTPNVAAEMARFGAASWPALYAAGHALISTQSSEWLQALGAFGPTAMSAQVRGAILSADLSEQILRHPGRYPLQWIMLAEASRSRLSVESPLLVSTTAWFQD